MDRREFLTKAALAAALIGIPVTVTSCGDDGGPTGTNSGDVTGTATGSGHTHSGVITRAQLNSAVGVTVTFTGSGHEHHLGLSDSEVQMIAGGQRVQKPNITTTGPGDPSHPHTYTFN